MKNTTLVALLLLTFAPLTLAQKNRKTWGQTGLTPFLTPDMGMHV
jgi:hypothetical protein